MTTPLNTRKEKPLSQAIVINRAHADASLRAYGAIVAMACGSALGAPWALTEPPSVNTELTMKGRADLSPHTWSETIHPAICVLEAASNEKNSGDTIAIQQEYARRLLAWYSKDTNGKQVNSALQAVLNEATRPHAYLERKHNDTTWEHHASNLPLNPLERLRDNARRRWETLRPRQRFSDNHILPLGVAAAVTYKRPAEAAREAATWANVTTADPLAAATSAYVAALINTVVNQVQWRWWQTQTQTELINIAVSAISASHASQEPSGETERNVIREHLETSLNPNSTLESNAGLTAVGALSRACSAVRYAAQEKARNQKLDIVRVGVDVAVRAGGDTEMVATISAAILGGVVGLSGIPEEWTRDLTGWPGMGVEGLRDLVVGARLQNCH